jgi:hypothetical protein
MDENCEMSNTFSIKTEKAERVENALKAEKKYKKTAEYKKSYKKPENPEKIVKFTKPEKFGNSSNQNMITKSSCKDVSIILEDKIKNNLINVSALELQAINEFLAILKINNQSEIKKPCHLGERCIVWKCKFDHPDTRIVECFCENNDCDKLHIEQALCKNPGHPDNCQMAHRMKDLY